MAEETDREQTRIRLLAMADDFDARARAAGDSAEAQPADPIEPPVEAAEPDEEAVKTRSRSKASASGEAGPSKRLTLGRRG